MNHKQFNIGYFYLVRKGCSEMIGKVILPGKSSGSKRKTDVILS